MLWVIADGARRAGSDTQPARVAIVTHAASDKRLAREYCQQSACWTQISAPKARLPDAKGGNSHYQERHKHV